MKAFARRRDGPGGSEGGYLKMRKRWHKLAAIPLALAFVAAACSGDEDDDDAGGETTEAPSDGTEAAAADTTAAAEATAATEETTAEGSEPAGSEPAGTEAAGSTPTVELGSVPVPRRLRRRLGHDHRPGASRERGRRDPAGARRVRRGQQHRDHLHRRRGLGSEHQHPGRRRQPARTSASSRSPASWPTSPATATSWRCRRTWWRRSPRTGPRPGSRSATSTTSSTACR